PVEGDIVALQMVTSGAGLLGLRPVGEGNHLFGGIRDFAFPFTGNSGLLGPERRPELIRAYVGAWPRPGLLSMLGLSPDQPDLNGFAPLPGEVGWQRTRDDFLTLSFKRDVLREVVPQLEMVEYE